MTEQISKILVVCVLIEGFITYFNSFFVSDYHPYQIIFSLILGITVAVCYKLDILELLDIKSEIPYIGSILTGVLFSRGSNYFHDLLNNLNIN